jgi:hypothetical protein
MKIQKILKQWKNIFSKKSEIKAKSTEITTRAKYLSKVFEVVVLNENNLFHFRKINSDDTEMLVKNEVLDSQFVEKSTVDKNNFQALTNKVNNSEKIVSDCRNYEEKKHEINDEELSKYLSKVKSKIRRNATCEMILRQPKNKAQFNSMVNLLHEDIFKNLLCEKMFFK